MSLPTNVTVGRSAALHVDDHNTLHALLNAIEAVGNGLAVVKDGAGEIVGGTVLTEEDLATALDNYAGTAAVYSTTITGNGSTTTRTITHGLNSGDISVRVRRAASGTSFTEGQDFIEESHTVTITGVDTISLNITPAITNTHVWRVTVIAWDKLEVLLGDSGGTALNVADTATVNLTVTAGELTADVVPGAISHGDIDDLDADDHTIYALADGSRGAFAPSAHTTAVNVHQYTPAATAIAAGTLTINLNTAKVFTTTLVENVTGITVTNWTAGKLDGFQMIWTFSTTSRTIAWPSGWLWPGGVVPFAPDEIGERLVVDVFSVDGGTTVFANAVPMKAAA